MDGYLFQSNILLHLQSKRNAVGCIPYFIVMKYCIVCCDLCWVKLSLCLNEHNIREVHLRVKLQVHTSITSIPDGGEWLIFHLFSLPLQKEPVISIGLGV
jgi:hypothetical protein